jgi:hypothetical protein
MKKKLLSISLTLSMIVSVFIPFTTYAASIGVNIDNVPVSFNDSTGYPFIDSSSRTQVPLRVTMEAYGCSVQWDSSDQAAIVQKDGTTVTVPIGAKYIVVNGSQVQNDTAALIQNNRTYLPIRAVLESFGASVSWNQSSHCVIVSSKAGSYTSTVTNTNKNTNTDTADIDVSTSYIGNKNSKIFHVSTCSYVSRMKSSNKVSLNSRSTAISSGYTPCKVCKP